MQPTLLLVVVGLGLRCVGNHFNYLITSYITVSLLCSSRDSIETSSRPHIFAHAVDEGGGNQALR